MTAKPKSPADNLAKTIDDLTRSIRRHVRDDNSEIGDALRATYRKLNDIQKRMEAREAPKGE